MKMEIRYVQDSQLKIDLSLNENVDVPFEDNEFLFLCFFF